MNEEGGNRDVGIERHAHHALSAFVNLGFGATFSAGLTYRIVDEGLQLGRISVGITRLDVLNGAVKNMGADGLL